MMVQVGNKNKNEIQVVKAPVIKLSTMRMERAVDLGRAPNQAGCRRIPFLCVRTMLMDYPFDT